MGRFTTTIFNGTQRCNAGTMLQPENFFLRDTRGKSQEGQYGPIVPARVNIGTLNVHELF